MKDGFCLAPVLTISKNGNPIAIKTLFERAGFCKPYFGESVDFNSDGKMDLHIMYEGVSIVADGDFSVLTLQGNSLALLSPEDAYLSAFYHIPQNMSLVDMHTEDRRFNHLVNALAIIAQCEASEGSLPREQYTNVCFDGPLEIKDVDKSGSYALRYLLTTYLENGTLCTYTVWLKPYDGECWGIVSIKLVSARSTDIIEGMITSLPFSYALPGELIKGTSK